MSERRFIIKIFLQDNSYGFLYKVRKTTFGYWKLRTKHIEKAKIWKYRKACENMITEFVNYPFGNEKLTYEIVEITDIQILRKLKIKKLQ